MSEGDHEKRLRHLEIGPIVSASHLASGAMPSLSELEFALTVTFNALGRWMSRCAAAAGQEALSQLEVQILHTTNHREREKTLSDLCLVLHIEDTHLVNYAVKKLIGLGLVKAGKRGKEKTVQATKKGAELAQRYKDIREALLIESVKKMEIDEADLSRIAGLLRALSGQYDQAARGAASL